MNVGFDARAYAIEEFRRILRQRKSDLKDEVIDHIDVIFKLDRLHASVTQRIAKAHQRDTKQELKTCKYEVGQLARGFAHVFATTLKEAKKQPSKANESTGTTLARATSKWTKQKSWQIARRFGQRETGECITDLLKII
jgi:hypothetical protein